MNAQSQQEYGAGLPGSRDLGQNQRTAAGHGKAIASTAAACPVPTAARLGDGLGLTPIINKQLNTVELFRY